MLERVRKMKKNKKGFTLVELIVVLVILAILIALLVPALTGYIDKANKKKVAAEARMMLTAVQTEVSNDYGKSDNYSPAAGTSVENADKATTVTGGLGYEIAKLASDLEDKYTPATTTFSTNAKGEVTALHYAGTKFSVDYDGDWKEPVPTTAP